MELKYMERAIELAKKGEGFTNPNPLVGAVIVKNDRIIGEGYHQKYGDLHAERNALKNCVDDPSGADIYVTLEPCCHHGKQPPCTDALIAAGIKNVFVGSYDPNPLVAGKSAEILKEHGINAEYEVMREECDKLNPIFFHFISTGMPYTIMKAAMSIDGRTASFTGDSKWITGETARKHTHYTRKRVAGIMVGVNTVIADDPMLNCRCDDPSDPIRIICDSHLRIPLDCRILKTASEIPVIIATVSDDVKKIDMIKNMGADVIITGRTVENRVDLKQLFKELGNRKIDSVLVEGGAEIHASMLDSGLVDKLQIYIAPKIIGGTNAKPVVGGKGVELVRDAYMFKNPVVTKLDEDILIEYEKA